MRSTKLARFASSFRRRPLRHQTATLGLAALLLLAAGPPASGQISFNFKIGGKGKTSRTAEVSKALAQEVAAVRQRFDQGRQALPVVTSPGGAPAHPRQAVVELIDVTERDLDRSIERVQEPELAGLRAWASAGIQSVREQLQTAPGARAVASSAGPQVVAVVASLGAYPLPAAAPAKNEPREQDTVAAERARQLLDQVGQAIGRLLFLAENDDLEVKLWVGTTPAQRARFRFWPQASVKGFPSTPAEIRTNGKLDHVMRGLYFFSVSNSIAATGGTVVESFQGGSGKNRDEALDLVNGSSFFCCRFENKVCHHVDSDKDCRPGRR